MFLRRHFAWTCTLLILSHLGCGSDTTGGRKVVNVSGLVKFDGTPVDRGEVFFESDDDERRGYSAPIKNGTYQVKMEPGPKIVKITASRDIPGKFQELPGPVGEPPRMLPVTESFLPAKYNTQSNLRFTVAPKGNDDANFELSP